MPYLNQSGLVQKDEIVVMLSNSDNYLNLAKITNNTNVTAIIEQSDDVKTWSDTIIVNAKQTKEVEITKRFIRLKDANEVYVRQNYQNSINNSNVNLNNPTNAQANIDMEELVKQVTQAIFTSMGIADAVLKNNTAISNYKEVVTTTKFLVTPFGEYPIIFRKNIDRFTGTYFPEMGARADASNVTDAQKIYVDFTYYLNSPTDLDVLKEFIDTFKVSNISIKQQTDRTITFTQTFNKSDWQVSKNDVLLNTIIQPLHLPHTNNKFNAFRNSNNEYEFMLNSIDAE